jgi:bacterioferritin
VANRSCEKPHKVVLVAGAISATIRATAARKFRFDTQPSSGNSTMDKSKLIEKLNEILRHEWTGVAQYAQAGFIVAGLWREVYSGMFFDSAKESFGHAKLVGEKIVALGGVPSVERNAIKQTNDLSEMLNYGLEFESKAVKLYNEALPLASGDRALEVFLENILEEEQDGVDKLTRILRDPKAVAASGGVAKAG